METSALKYNNEWSFVNAKAVFNESTCSEIERLENEFVKFEVKLDTDVERKATAKKQINWTSGYICKPRRERVKWDSKIYHLERSLAEKTLDEQAECLMDAVSGIPKPV